MRQQRHHATVLHSIEEGLCTDDSPCPGVNMIACYLEKSATPAERRRLESHFASCRSCRGDLLELRKIMKAPEVKTPFEAVEAALALSTRHETGHDPEQGTPEQGTPEQGPEDSNDHYLILV
ncbi:zf-HC2 domain-containing protein [Nitratidesulfovibrio sp. D1]|uniref:zf-HC2 domain-containing protein n=1 Tax=Nitratidesulfovibrio sp. D1 TaxID=3440151 RepID=UPI003EC02CB6